MSHIHSPIEEIDRLSILSTESLANKRPLNITKAVRAGKTFILIDDQGRLYSNSVKDRVSYSVGFYHFTTSLMEALRAAGVISSKAVKAHLKECSVREEKSNRRHSARNILDYAKSFGLTLTSEQKKKLESEVAE